MVGRACSFVGASLLAIALAAPAAYAQTGDLPTSPSTEAAAPVPVDWSLPAASSGGPLRPLAQEIDPYYGNVRAFWGDVNPFYGKVRAFWSDVDPFYGKVRAFWGDLDPAQLADAAGAPRYDKVGPFWNKLGRHWNRIAEVWATAGAYNRESARDYLWIARQFRALIKTSRVTWKSAVIEQTAAASFDEGFVDPFLARYNLSLDDPRSFAKLDAATQSRLFVEFYDGLMAFSGTDHADWWMRAINWKPQLTQTMGSGAGSTLGLVDDYATKSVDIQTRVQDLTKKSGSPGGHGEGVLSLIVAGHDGKGVMGIAPGASVIAYNPFTDGGAEWSDVSAGIQAVAAKGATVINLSLGAPGVTLSSEWQKIFTRSEINAHKDKTLYIIAAGNDGITQSGIVDMKGALDTTFIVVGSVGPAGISEFSNRPGTTCLTDGGTECKGSSSLKESGYLMNRFIVAPGELILVSDGKGGLIRQSGTSLAAPLVAGVVALVQDRWPWMREKPRDIAMVILNSAKDMGAPGIDPVYGVGMLDVEAAMSPLDFNALKYYLTSTDGKSQNEVSVSTLRRSGIQSSWAERDMYFTAFEKLDQVERDFLIPLSARLYGRTRNREYFQSFVYDRMVSWLGGSAGFAATRAGFVDGARGGTVPAGGGWTMRMSGRLVSGYSGDSTVRRALLRSTMTVASPSGRLGLRFGSGDGAVALGGGADLSLASDFDGYSGGANPLLGFASGGAHMAAEVALTPALSVRAGMTEQRRAIGYDLADGIPADRIDAARPVGRYRASAAMVRMDYDAASWLRLSTTATSLREPNAFLGVRPILDADLAGGTTTTGITMGAHAALGGGLALFGTATAARGASPDRVSALRIGEGGVTGGAFVAGVAKQGLIGRADALRLTVASPLRFTGGAIALTEVQVVDRQTGEKGLVTRRFAIGDAQPRRLVVEGQYNLPFLEGRGQLGLFGRGEVRDVDAGVPRVMLGSQVQFAL
jgi:hypothetical protein